MSKVNALRTDMQSAPSYRLGWRMAMNGKPRPNANIISYYRERGLRWGFCSVRALDAAEARHALLLMGWDDFVRDEVAA